MSNVQYMLNKLYAIDKDLGGNAANNEKKHKDPFIALKDQILEIFSQMRGLINQKNAQTGQRNTDVIKIEADYKKKMEQAEKLMNKLNELLRKQQKQAKKSEKQDIEMKQKFYENIRSQMKEMALLDASAVPDTNNSMETLTDRKQNLFNEGKGLKEPLKPQIKEQSAEEKDAMQRWRANSMEQDKKLENIIGGVQEWNKAAVLMGEKLDEQSGKIQRLDEEVEKTNNELESTNKQLKKIVDHYRKPSKFCLDIVLVLMILGLGVTLYYYFK